MAKIFVTRSIPGPGLPALHDSSHDVAVNPNDRALTTTELHAGIAGADAVLTQLGDKVDAAFMNAAGPQLRCISNYAVGYNNVDVAEASKRNIVVCNTPGVLTDATADIAWTLLLGVARRASEGDRMIRTNGFEGWTPTMLLGGDLVGKTLAIIGAGRIGYAVAKRATGWDMKLQYVARSAHGDFEALGAERVELDAALRAADYVSLHVPLTDQTRHLIDAARLKLMKPTAYLINTARGPVIDESALVDALKSGTIAGAGLDVYEQEPKVHPGLAECANTLLLPHLGSATIQTRSEMSHLAAQNLLNVLSGSRPLHAVNDDVVTRLGLTA
ncbi:MAG: D-glycerate dehydrogenase [Phycisphaera sp.]|nr:D-glycerate dehydrogenase [Phycisphaera sp.]